MTKKMFLFLSIILVLLNSCLVTNTLNINKDLSFKDSTSVKIFPEFKEILDDMKDLSSEKNMEKEFVSFIKDNKNISNFKYKKENDLNYTSSFDSKSLIKLFESLNKDKKQSLLKVTKDSISFNLSMDNLGELEQMLPFLTNDEISSFGPRENIGMSQEEYYEMISYVLGEDSENMIKNSKLTITIKSEKPIKKVINGTKQSSHSALFTLNLIDFLLLSKPITYKIEF